MYVSILLFYDKVLELRGFSVMRFYLFIYLFYLFIFFFCRGILCLFTLILLTGIVLYILFILFCFCKAWTIWRLSALRKHAYSNILKISPPKTESFQIKILIFFLYFYSEHRLWVLVRTASSRRF